MHAPACIFWADLTPCWRQTVRQIAALYAAPAAELMRLNRNIRGLTPVVRLKAGTQIALPAGAPARGHGPGVGSGPTRTQNPHALSSALHIWPFERLLSRRPASVRGQRGRRQRRSVTPAGRRAWSVSTRPARR